MPKPQAIADAQSQAQTSPDYETPDVRAAALSGFARAALAPDVDTLPPAPETFGGLVGASWPMRDAEHVAEERATRANADRARRLRGERGAATVEAADYPPGLAGFGLAGSAGAFANSRLAAMGSLGDAPQSDGVYMSGPHGTSRAGPFVSFAARVVQIFGGSRTTTPPPVPTSAAPGGAAALRLIVAALLTLVGVNVSGEQASQLIAVAGLGYMLIEAVLIVIGRAEGRGLMPTASVKAALDSSTIRSGIRLVIGIVAGVFGMTALPVTADQVVAVVTLCYAVLEGVHSLRGSLTARHHIQAR